MILKGKSEKRSENLNQCSLPDVREKETPAPATLKTKQNSAQTRERRKIFCHRTRNVWQLNELLHQAHFGEGYEYKHQKIFFRAPKREQMLIRTKLQQGRLNFVLSWCCIISSSHPLSQHCSLCRKESMQIVWAIEAMIRVWAWATGISTAEERVRSAVSWVPRQAR